MRYVEFRLTSTATHPHTHTHDVGSFPSKSNITVELIVAAVSITNEGGSIALPLDCNLYSMNVKSTSHRILYAKLWITIANGRSPSTNHSTIPMLSSNSNPPCFVLLASPHCDAASKDHHYATLTSSIRTHTIIFMIIFHQIQVKYVKIAEIFVAKSQTWSNLGCERSNLGFMFKILVIRSKLVKLLYGLYCYSLIDLINLYHLHTFQPSFQQILNSQHCQVICTTPQC